MPKLYNVYLVEGHCDDYVANMLVVAETENEAISKGEQEWFDEITLNQGYAVAYEVGIVNGYKVQLVKVNQPRKFYFTFGTDELYPFQGGWVEITAPNKREALRIFKKHYPNREGSNCYNAADCYDSDTFKNHTDMFTTGNLGAFCHAKIQYEEE